MTDQPIACTLDLRDRAAVQTHLDAFRALFTHLVATDRIPGGFRWRFRDVPGLEEAMRAAAEREQACCAFYTFTLGRAGGELFWETRAPDEAAPVVEELARLPDRLRVV
jgi:MerR family copper efflux transcriptional regulator